MSSAQADLPLKLMGSPGSPYTRKMIALLRYRRIPYAVLWGGHQMPPPGLPEPKVKLLPTFYLPDAEGKIEAVVDSTPIIRRLERDFQGRSVLPEDPVLAFLNDLIEDFGDEWMTKAMFHFRWAHAPDIANAEKLLVFWGQPSLPRSEAETWGKTFAERQINRLYVVGSNATTGPTIESSYRRVLRILDDLVQRQLFVLGARPASADYGLYGQLTQLAIVEPTSAALAMQDAPRVRAWLDLLEDMSGHEPAADQWIDRGSARDRLSPLLQEIGRVYAPALLANARAITEGKDQFETEIDGRPWTQPVFAYQAKCLTAIREAYATLSAQDKADLGKILSGTGCETLIA